MPFASFVSFSCVPDPLKTTVVGAALLPGATTDGDVVEVRLRRHPREQNGAVARLGLELGDVLGRRRVLNLRGHGRRDDGQVGLRLGRVAGAIRRGGVIRVVPSGSTSGALFVTGTGPSIRSRAFAVARNVDTAGSLRDTDCPPPDETDWSCGTLRAGFVVSTTFTGNDAVLTFPGASLAVQVTVDEPSGKSAPEPGRQATSTGPLTRSTALGDTYVTRVPPGLSASAVIPSGTRLKTGAVVSWTVTLNFALALLPFPSVAVHVTVVTVIGKTEPESGTQAAAMFPLTMSVAEAENDTGAPFGPIASVAMSSGTETDGAVVSRTVTVNVFGALWLPESSEAVQLTVVVVIGNVLPEGGEHETVGVGSTRSEAVAVKPTAAPPGPVASVVMSAGTVSVGAVVSCTVTVKESPSEFPESSVATHVTVVVPRGNVLPDGGAHATLTLVSTRSVADAENETAAPPGPVAGVVMLAGTVIDGGAVSCTVTPKDAEPVLPCASVALQLTVVVTLTGNVLPDEGEQFVETEPSTMSVAEAEKDTAAPPGPVASAVMPDGTLTLGGVVSSTVTLKLSEKTVTTKAGSVAVHVTVVSPSANVLPETGVQLTSNPGTTVVGGSHVTVAPAEDVASTTWSEGKVSQPGSSATAAGVTRSAASATSETTRAR